MNYPTVKFGDDKSSGLGFRVLTYIHYTHTHTHAYTYRQTDGRTTYDSNTALCTTCILR